MDHREHDEESGRRRVHRHPTRSERVLQLLRPISWRVPDIGDEGGRHRHEPTQRPSNLPSTVKDPRESDGYSEQGTKSTKQDYAGLRTCLRLRDQPCQLDQGGTDTSSQRNGHSRLELLAEEIRLTP